jgi:hypothetical protein
MAVIQSLPHDDAVCLDAIGKNSREKDLLVCRFGQGKSTYSDWVTGRSVTHLRISVGSRTDDHGCLPDRY